MSMIYEIFLESESDSVLRSLPIDIRKRIVEKLDAAQNNPFHFFVRLKDRSDYKLRIGAYRVIADIDVATRMIKVTKIGHRKNVYD